MKIVLNYKKSIQENAQSFFDQSKKLRQKIIGAQAGIKEVKQKLLLAEKKVEKAKKGMPEIKRSKEWFEKFRWCYTTNGLLLVGGRDAHSNEALVKKHMEKDDWYFHADLDGSPHCLLKEGQKKAKQIDLDEAAVFAAMFSSMWKKGVLSARVYRVTPEHVSKKAPSGESIGKGAFMISGKREWYDPQLQMGWGVQETPDGYRAMCGALSAVKKNTQHVQEIVPGRKTKTDIAKSYLKYLAKLDKPIFVPLDELVAALPTGEFAVKGIMVPPQKGH